MSRTRVAVAVGFSLVFLGALAAPAANASNLIFWTTPYSANQIFYANLDGSSTTISTVNTAHATVDTPWGIAFDASTGKVYWANYGTGAGTTISYANLNGTGGGDLNTTGATVDGPSGVVVDQATGKIYWANSTGNTISWANLNGTGGGNLFTGAGIVNHPVGVAIDPNLGEIYWANYNGNSSDGIAFAELDDSGGGNLMITGTTINDPWGVAIDSATGKIYWGNFLTNTLDDANLNGTGGATFSTSGATQSGPMMGAIDPNGGRIYWANWSAQTISVANLDGSGDGKVLYNTGVDPAMPAILESPAGTGAPGITGGAGAPTTLSCSRGTWGSDFIDSLLYRAPQTFSYSWSKNGVPIAGATTSSISATSGGSYSCQVTATNFAGSSTQTSTSYSLANVATTSVSASASGNRATLAVSCHGVTGQTCAGPVSVTVHEHKKGKKVVGVTAGKHKGGGKKTVAVTLVSSSYSVAGGNSVKLHLTLNKVGKQLLTRFVSLRTTLGLSPGVRGPHTLTFRYAQIKINRQLLIWHVFVHSFTTAESLTIRPIPSGATVQIACSGGGCPFSRHTAKAHKRQVTVTKLFGSHHLHPGTRVTFRITAPNHIGETLTYALRALPFIPKPTIRCLAPGSKRAVKCG